MLNETFITGNAVEYGVLSSRLLNIQPEQTIYKLTITVISSQEIAGIPSLLKVKEGEQYYRLLQVCSFSGFVWQKDQDGSTSRKAESQGRTIFFKVVPRRSYESGAFVR
jgi:hypothetical protein